MSDGEIGVETFERCGIVPVELGGSIVNVILVERLDVPGIALCTFCPDEISGRCKASAQVRNDGGVNWVGVAGSHVGGSSVGVSHDEVIQHVFHAGWASKGLRPSTPNAQCCDEQIDTNAPQITLP